MQKTYHPVFFRKVIIHENTDRLHTIIEIFHENTYRLHTITEKLCTKTLTDYTSHQKNFAVIFHLSTQKFTHRRLDSRNAKPDL